MRRRFLQSVVVSLVIMSLLMTSSLETQAQSTSARRVNFTFSSNCSGFVFRNAYVSGRNQSEQWMNWAKEEMYKSSFIPSATMYGSTYYYWWKGTISITYTSYRRLSYWPYTESYSKYWSGTVSTNRGDPVTIAVPCK